MFELEIIYLISMHAAMGLQPGSMSDTRSKMISTSRITVVRQFNYCFTQYHQPRGQRAWPLGWIKVIHGFGGTIVPTIIYLSCVKFKLVSTNLRINFRLTFQN